MYKSYTALLARQCFSCRFVRSKEKGFTLVELMIVLAILVFLIAVSLPLAINFYQTRQLDIHTQGIVQALRRAQMKAMSVEADSSFGVYITSDQYILFKGDTYAARDVGYDETFDLPENLSVSGLSGVVFSRLKGAPSSTGTTILTIDNRSGSVNINEIGRVNYE